MEFVRNACLSRNAWLLNLVGGATKQIEYGFDISCLVLQPIDFHCLLDVHPDQRQHIQYESEFRASGSISHALTHDNFGNRMRRISAGPGQIVLSCRGVLSDGGPDGSKLRTLMWL